MFKSEAVEKKEFSPQGVIPGGKWLLRSVLLLCLVTAVILAYLYRGQLQTVFQENFGKIVADNEVSYIVPLREFRVNLADPGARSYLLLRIYLGFDDKKLHREIGRREAEIRSEIIALLRAKRIIDLSGPGGMELLQQDIVTLLNQILVSGKIRTVYFDDFIIQ